MIFSDCSVANFHQHTAESCQVYCRYPRTHAVWEVIFRRRNPTPTPSSLAHCNRYQLSQTLVFFLAVCLTDSLIFLYILFSTSLLSHLPVSPLSVFFTLHFLPSTYFCLPAHIPQSCTAAEDIFSVHHLWSLRSALLHRKTLQWNIHLLDLL